MALINYTLPFGSVGPSSMSWSTIATGLQTPRADAVNGLLYDPADHQPQPSQQYNSNGYYNDPYAPPYQRSQFSGHSNHYLPPQPTTRPPQTPFSGRSSSSSSVGGGGGYRTPVQPTRSYSEGSYSSRQGPEKDTRGTYYEQVNYRTDSAPASFSNTRTTPSKPTLSRTSNRPRDESTDSSSTDAIPERPRGYVKVQGGQGKKTQTVAVVDYDEEESEEDEYYDAEDGSLEQGL